MLMLFKVNKLELINSKFLVLLIPNDEQFPIQPLGPPLHTFSKLQNVPFDFLLIFQQVSSFCLRSTKDRCYLTKDDLFSSDGNFMIV